ncbi:GDP-mannose 4,6-dehydratase [Ferruginibacter sp. SUN106]|uniref:GDP-mannose 4,6-dehydratase n=1 Tax=Ferruginibacter sp. SUN106 TaxID=2978348 RepID=UPI003D35E25A
MSKILVTGCAGFIGSHLCELLLSKGFEVIGVDNFDPFYDKKIKEKNLGTFIDHENFSFYDIDITRDLATIPTQPIDAIVHLAAKAGVRPSIEDPAGYIHTNIVGTEKILAFMKDNAITKLVFASSSSVYGNNKKIPFSETDNVDNPISPYAFTKKAGELLNYNYHHLYNFDIINLRFFTVYGPRQRPDLAIHKFIKKIARDEKIILFGDGSTARDYTYVDDTVQGIMKALNYCMNNSNLFLTLNLGNNNPVQLNDLVNLIYQEMGKEKNISYTDMQPGDVDITFADIENAKKILGYAPSIDISTGISKFVNWMKAST